MPQVPPPRFKKLNDGRGVEVFKPLPSHTSTARKNCHLVIEPGLPLIQPPHQEKTGKGKTGTSPRNERHITSEEPPAQTGEKYATISPRLIGLSRWCVPTDLDAANNNAPSSSPVHSDVHSQHSTEDEAMDILTRAGSGPPRPVKPKPTSFISYNHLDAGQGSGETKASKSLYESSEYLEQHGIHIKRSDQSADIKPPPYQQTAGNSLHNSQQGLRTVKEEPPSDDVVTGSGYLASLVADTPPAANDGEGEVASHVARRSANEQSDITHTPEEDDTCSTSPSSGQSDDICGHSEGQPSRTVSPITLNIRPASAQPAPTSPVASHQKRKYVRRLSSSDSPPPPKKRGRPKIHHKPTPPKNKSLAKIMKSVPWYHNSSKIQKTTRTDVDELHLSPAHSHMVTREKAREEGARRNDSSQGTSDNNGSTFKPGTRIFDIPSANRQEADSRRDMHIAYLEGAVEKQGQMILNLQHELRNRPTNQELALARGEVAELKTKLEKLDDLIRENSIKIEAIRSQSAPQQPPGQPQTVQSPTMNNGFGAGGLPFGLFNRPPNAASVPLMSTVHPQFAPTFASYLTGAGEAQTSTQSMAPHSLSGNEKSNPAGAVQNLVQM